MPQLIIPPAFPLTPPAKVETWDGLFRRVGLALDESYYCAEGEQLLPEDSFPLHTFVCPNGVTVAIMQVNLPDGDEGIYVSTRFGVGQTACCPTSLAMLCGEALSKLLPGLWHNPQYLKSHFAAQTPLGTLIQMVYADDLVDAYNSLPKSK